MKFQEWLTEKTINTEKLSKIIKVFERIPSGTSDSISDYITSTLIAFGIKSENKGYTYLSGPMTNLPDDNWPVFIYAEKYINGKVINPAKPHGKILKKAKSDFDWIDYMVEDVYELVKCDKMVLLPGYSKSMGAKIEILIGKKLMNIKPKEFKKIISDKEYKLFIEDVKKQFIGDGFENEYYSIIEPMLLSESEKDATKFVKTHVPKKRVSEGMNEGITDIIKNFTGYIKDGSIKNILRLIGLILKKSGIKKVVR